nr:hypothetical protein [Tanacetum cinerariifolium]
MGIPNEHQLKFNSIKDAKKLMEAVENRFGRNAATRKIQRNLLNQQYEKFTAPSSKMLDQTFNRLQKLMSQLELLEEKLSKKIIYDLYNSLKVYERKVKGMSSSSSSTQNMTFVSSLNNNTSNTNEAVNTAQAVNTTHGVSTASTHVNATYSTNIDNLNDMKEIDLKWQMAMLTMRAIRFLKNKRRKLTVNGNETIGFDKSKVECYNCHKMGHFARECRASRNKDNKNKESLRRSVPVEKYTSITLVSCDGRLGGYDWSDKVKEWPNYAFMAFLSSSSDLEIVDNYKKGLGYENYNEVPSPYTGNFMPPTHDLSFISLDELVNKSIVKNCKAMSSEEEPKEVRNKAFRVFNSRTRLVEENLHIRFSKSTPNVVGTQSNGFACTKASDNAYPKSSHDDESKPLSDDEKKVDEDPRKESKCKDQEKEDNINSTNNVNIVGNINAADTNKVNVVGGKISIKLTFDLKMPALEDDSIFNFSSDDEDDDAVADMNNFDTTI